MTVGILLGGALEYRAFLSGAAGKFDSDTLMNAAGGFLCFLCCRLDREFYLSGEGIVSETRCWGRLIKRVAPWNTVKAVRFLPGAKNLTVIFDVTPRVWKLPFPKESGRDIADFLAKFLPDGADVTGSFM